MRVRLRDTPEIEQRTRELVAAESECCAFLDFTLGREGGAIVLEIVRARGRAAGDRDALQPGQVNIAGASQLALWRSKVPGNDKSRPVGGS